MKISVCIATFNGERYIVEQLESILTQLSEEDEIIISDDHSTDKTIDLIKNISDKRISIFENNGRTGYTGNFENALSRSTGDIIFLSDQDDVWLPKKVEHSLEYLRYSDFLVSNAIVVNKDKEIIYKSFFDINCGRKTFIGNIYRFAYLGCCMTFKRNVLAVALPFPKNSRLCTHDNWLFVVSSLYYKIKIVDEPMILYRRHGYNTSLGAEKNIKRNSILFMIRYRIYLIMHLIMRFYRVNVGRCY